MSKTDPQADKIRFISLCSFCRILLNCRSLWLLKLPQAGLGVLTSIGDTERLILVNKL